jgi:uncharacterized membrane protein YkgB
MKQLDLVFDKTVIPFIKKYYIWFARVSFFIVYFWFGILKILYTSPANPLVAELQAKTLPFISFDQFIVFFSLFEMLIGILFLIPKLTRIAFILFIVHMGTTLMPLFLLPKVAWQGFLVPTLEGQYMIKNTILIALASSILVNTPNKLSK